MENNYDINETYKGVLSQQALVSFNGTDLNTISEAIKKLKLIKTNDDLSEELRNKAEAIEIILYIKYLFIRYKSLDFDQAFATDVKASLDKLTEKAINLKLTTSTENCSKALNAYFYITNILAEYKQIQAMVLDEFGNYMPNNNDNYNQVIERLDKLIENTTNNEEIEIFENKKIILYNIKEAVVFYLEERKKELLSTLKEMNEADVKKLFSEILINLDDLIDYNAMFCQDAILNDNKKGFIFCSTPIEKEIELMVYGFAKNTNREFALFDLSVLNKKDTQFIERAFNILNEGKKNLLLKGFDLLDTNKMARVIECCLKYDLTNCYLVFWDRIGDGSFYKKACGMANTLGISSTLINQVYLMMPLFNDLCELFSNRKMIEPNEISKVKDNLQFLGYSGLNVVYKAFVEGKYWIDDAINISRNNDSDYLRRYLKNIPSQSQFLDLGWGKLVEEKHHTYIKRDFDYDLIRDCNINNVNKILNSKYRVYEKCGLITRYALLHGDDISVWLELDDKERLARLTEAIYYVYYILGIDYKPEVALKDKVCDSETTLGVCISGGKRIELQKKAMKDFEQAMKTLNHECYHSFQHFAETHNYCESWWYDFGITQSMISEWAANFNEYISTDDNQCKNENYQYRCYRRQVVEAYANMFGLDCLVASNNLYKDIDFE